MHHVRRALIIIIVIAIIIIVIIIIIAIIVIVIIVIMCVVQFLGPTASVMTALGDKVSANILAQTAEVGGAFRRSVRPSLLGC